MANESKMDVIAVRLTCPNCEAQYEVPDDAVPAAGREVQCSNCGHTWFAQPKSAGFATRGPEPKPTPAPARPPRPKPEPPVEAEVAPNDPPAAAQAQAQRQSVSDNAKSVLREEA
ncbi:MAG: zinc-ribbon domain-containing protein, partial [Pseudomonadota bacterium]